MVTIKVYEACISIVLELAYEIQ